MVPGHFAPRLRAAEADRSARAQARALRRGERGSRGGGGGERGGSGKETVHNINKAKRLDRPTTRNAQKNEHGRGGRCVSRDSPKFRKPEAARETARQEGRRLHFINKLTAPVSLCYGGIRLQCAVKKIPHCSPSYRGLGAYGSPPQGPQGLCPRDSRGGTEELERQHACLAHTPLTE